MTRTARAWAPRHEEQVRLLAFLYPGVAAKAVRKRHKSSPALAAELAPLQLEVRSKLAKAGAVADASAINAAWPLEDAAPGFVACAAHTRRGWVLLLEDAGCAAWWRDCRLPGLRHELLAPRRWWTAANDAAKVETAGLASWAYAKSAPRGH